MDFAAELARFNPDPALANWLSATFQQTQQELKAAHIKIQALTLELAHHRRLRFANKSEAFSAEQKQLFEETWNADAGAIEAEAEQVAPERKPRERSRAGRQPLPENLARIEYRHEPASCTCGQCGGDLVKIG